MPKKQHGTKPMHNKNQLLFSSLTFYSKLLFRSNRNHVFVYCHKIEKFTYMWFSRLDEYTDGALLYSKCWNDQYSCVSSLFF